MTDLAWYISRLRAMSIGEVLWRLGQKRLEKAERKTFGKEHRQIAEAVFYKEKESLVFCHGRLPIAERGRGGDVRTETSAGAIAVPLLCGYNYNRYKKDWHAGFQTDAKWPLTFSYALQYKQRDEIGDARTNWELNRHFQFALLACGYYRTGDAEYVAELSDLFEDWNRKNPFLHGISWTSVMEAAIRDINWIYTLGFLERAGRTKQSERLCGCLQNGIVNMTAYIASHYSRFSSANNHVVVEAAAIGIAGIVMACEEWYDLAFSILQYEIARQNYADGVNREVSLHYESFFMEAVGLLILTMQVNHMRIPQNWRNVLCKMSRYVSDCQGSYGETAVFGDDDAGKILDLEGEYETLSGAGDGSDLGGGLCGRKRSHYQYVLQLMSIVLPERYADRITDRTLLCIVPEKMRRQADAKPYYKRRGSVCYEAGGVSLLKSRDGMALIGIDHGELGFGSIAAHGHADALSFQMFLEGTPVFADAGTYIYHIRLEERNAFRRTDSHNTVTLGGKDQSEMLGAFLWGKRAETTLLAHNLPVGNMPGAADQKGERTEDENGSAVQYVEAEHDGYAPVIHRRRFAFDGVCRLKIHDSLFHIEKETAYEVNFLLGAACRVKETAGGVFEIAAKTGQKVRMHVKAPAFTAEIRDAWVSEEYGKKSPAAQIRIAGKAYEDMTIVTEITWEHV